MSDQPPTSSRDRTSPARQSGYPDPSSGPAARPAHACLMSRVPHRAQIEEMLTIAARVPDHGKLAPWRFVVYAAGEARARPSATQHRRHRQRPDNPDGEEAQIEKGAGGLLQRAPIVIAVISRARPQSQDPGMGAGALPAGAACQNLILAASRDGLSRQLDHPSGSPSTGGFLDALEPRRRRKRIAG